MLLSSFYPPVARGGAEKAASLLAQALARAGHEVVVIACHPQREEIVEERDGVRVYRIPLDNVYWPIGRTEKEHPLMRLLWHLIDVWNWRAARRVGRILDREKPDVVHSHLIAGLSVAVWREARRRGIRVVHTMHDYYLVCTRSSTFRAGRTCERQCTGCRLITLPKKAASSRLDQVVSVSGFVLDRHRQFGYIADVPGSTVFNVLDAPVLEDSTRDLHEELVFGYIGKVDEGKGVGLLVEAAQRLHRADWRLRIAGSGLEGYIEGLKQRFPDPRIEWLGFTDPDEFYRSIDVAIVPSIWADPLPYVTVEALFAGKSLIYAQSGGIPEIAALGRVVSSFAPGNAAALAESMELALADKETWRSGGFLDPHSADLFSGPVVAAANGACYSKGSR